MRNKCLSSVMGVLFLVAGPSRAQDAKTLRLSVEVVGSEYCQSGDLDVWELKVKLKYTNESSRDLILLKAMPVVQVKFRGTGPSNNFELPLDRISLNISRLPPAPSADFAILKPRESTGNSDAAQIFVKRTIQTSIGVQHGSEGFLELVVSPLWRRADSLQAQSRWSAFGSLWTENLGSDPLLIRVPEQPASQLCRNQ
jgi:hypothetical protein